jgi:hypothetical protein
VLTAPAWTVLRLAALGLALELAALAALGLAALAALAALGLAALALGLA